jgi:hypothetical protein
MHPTHVARTELCTSAAAHKHLTPRCCRRAGPTCRDSSGCCASAAAPRRPTCSVKALRDINTKLPNPSCCTVPQQCTRACRAWQLHLELCRSATACCAALNVASRHVPLLLVQRAAMRSQQLQGSRSNSQEHDPRAHFLHPLDAAGPRGIHIPRGRRPCRSHGLRHQCLFEQPWWASEHARNKAPRGGELARSYVSAAAGSMA